MLLLPVGAELIQFEEAGWTSGSRVNFAAENPGLPIHRAALIQHDLDGLVIIAAPREEVYTCGNGYCSGGSEPKQCAA